MRILGPIADPIDLPDQVLGQKDVCPPGYGVYVVDGQAAGCITASQIQARIDAQLAGGDLFSELGTALQNVAPLTNLIVPGASLAVSAIGEALDYEPVPLKPPDLTPLSEESTMFEEFDFGSLFDTAGDYISSAYDAVTDFTLESGLLSEFLPVTAGLAANALMPSSSAIPVAAKTPVIPKSVIPGVAGVGAAVGKRFAQKFPNLAVSMQKLRMMGHKMSRSKLYGMMKRWGPEFLVGAGLLTAQAVYELAMAGPGTRRMNPANAKALRRAARRIRGFHRLCGHADLLKSRSKRPCRKSCSQ